MHIDIWSDIACPWCYIGLRHMRAALSKFERKDEVTVRLHAFLLQPELSTTLSESEPDFLARTKGMTREEVDEALTAITKLAREDGIDIDWENTQVAPTTSAHRLVSLAREIDMERDTTTGPDTLELRVNEALQRARFELGMDVSNPESLIALAQDFDIPGDRVLAALESQESASEVFSDFQIGVQMGMSAVPVFIFDNALMMESALPTRAFENAIASAWNHAHPNDQVEE